MITPLSIDPNGATQLAEKINEIIDVVNGITDPPAVPALSVLVDPTIPPGEVHFLHGPGHVAAKITNIGDSLGDFPHDRQR